MEFQYNYSAAQSKEAQKIRSQYTEKDDTRLDELRKLDAQVKRPANVFGYTFGSISAIVMGSGMSLVMTDIGGMIGLSEPLIPGIMAGIIGMIPMALAYPVYNRVLKKERQRIAPEILRLSDELLK